MSAVFAWYSKMSGKNVDSWESLKNGVALCETVNALKSGTIKQVSTYNAPFKHMGNIDNFLKVADKLGIAPEDRFGAEDLYYENNLAKVELTLTLFANAASQKFGVAPISTSNVGALRSEAVSVTAQGGGKKRQTFNGLGIFDSNAKNHQELASEEARQKDRLVKKDMQDHVPTAELSLLQADQSDKQKMITSAKRSGQDLIIRSKEEATATADLGMFGADQVQKQKMITSAKRSGQDLIIRSKEEATATGDLGYFGSDQVEKQKMISGAKGMGQDKIIKNRGERDEVSFD